MFIDVSSNFRANKNLVRSVSRYNDDEKSEYPERYLLHIIFSKDEEYKFAYEFETERDWVFSQFQTQEFRPEFNKKNNMEPTVENKLLGHLSDQDRRIKAEAYNKYESDFKDFVKKNYPDVEFTDKQISVATEYFDNWMFRNGL